MLRPTIRSKYNNPPTQPRNRAHKGQAPPGRARCFLRGRFGLKKGVPWSRPHTARNRGGRPTGASATRPSTNRRNATRSPYPKRGPGLTRPGTTSWAPPYAWSVLGGRDPGEQTKARLEPKWYILASSASQDTAAEQGKPHDSRQNRGSPTTAFTSGAPLVGNTRGESTRPPPGNKLRIVTYT